MKENKEKKKSIKPIKSKENPKEKATKEMSPEMIAQALRKWLMDN